MNNKIKVTVWNEFVHERTMEEVRNLYPLGIHTVIANYLNKAGMEAVTATLDQPEHGLTEQTLDNTDVLIWWGHMHHHEVDDEIVEKVRRKVLAGMGLIVLHSGHNSKIFKKLLGSDCRLKWRESGDMERLWVVKPGHPIAEGIGDYIELEHEEMYGEIFDIPDPDELVFVSWFSSGEVFRSGCTFTRGKGKIFYFRPGHETYPTFYNEKVLRVIQNGVKWAKPLEISPIVFGHAGAVGQGIYNL
ncbi:ThuA domain-containing protein [Paenibacillus radicis (ex Xue et al. 2023)]|uniref:ThuA domain-containing protein n=1 Tax=Paenibacillus radicis (ex Xue et al. 2023) TaxID=2972489 RepID=A0ABT1YLZ4_9BACL|nr:ThuA domain-containing protein [Paenibacillus radicis (ex Xue et al. 2023)]MCR8634201.1 ThuA domain-containing protein [Paenibacillus radicis (ex Xue et al. 2023)]